jgi:hypothetical protein
MARRRFFKRSKLMKNNNRRRVLLKRIHQRVLHRRKTYQNAELSLEYAKVG